MVTKGSSKVVELMHGLYPKSLKVVKLVHGASPRGSKGGEARGWVSPWMSR